MTDDLFPTLIRADETTGKSGPDWEIEDRFGGIIAGIDEVGRGPWAGPVITAAVILDRDNIPTGLADSKKLTAKKREALAPLILESAEVSFGEASVEEIDELNILAATMLAMQRAFAGLTTPVNHILVDGNRLPPLPVPATAVIKGDGRSLSIAAASIVAKVKRDFLMQELGKSFPGYGWEKNAGYGTKDHQAGLKALGVTQHHRKSFKPIHKILYGED